MRLKLTVCALLCALVLFSGVIAQDDDVITSGDTELKVQSDDPLKDISPDTDNVQIEDNESYVDEDVDTDVQISDVQVDTDDAVLDTEPEEVPVPAAADIERDIESVDDDNVKSETINERKDVSKARSGNYYLDGDYYANIDMNNNGDPNYNYGKFLIKFYLINSTKVIFIMKIAKI